MREFNQSHVFSEKLQKHLTTPSASTTEHYRTRTHTLLDNSNYVSAACACCACVASVLSVLPLLLVPVPVTVHCFCCLCLVPVPSASRYFVCCRSAYCCAFAVVSLRRFCVSSCLCLCCLCLCLCAASAALCLCLCVASAACLRVRALRLRAILFLPRCLATFPTRPRHNLLLGSSLNPCSSEFLDGILLLRASSTCHQRSQRS